VVLPSTVVVPWRRPPEVWSLAALCLVAAVMLGVVASWPLSPESASGMHALLSVVALGVATLLLVLPSVPGWLLHGCLLLWFGVVSLLVATSVVAVGSAATAVAYTWSSLYTAHFFRPGIARAYAGLTAVVLAGALLVTPRPGDATLWLVITLTVGAGGEVISRLHRQMRRAAVTDELTGVYNRAGLVALGGREVAAARRSGAPLCVAVLDLDDFKQVNDQQGHAAGDRLLAALAQHWRTRLRPADLLFRSGGDEFVLLLPATTREQGEVVLERLRADVGCSWSTGLADFGPDDSLETGLARADRELYDAKSRRRSGPAAAVR
jgi:diguanylate cyclase (GGDEF)-like protein